MAEGRSEQPPIGSAALNQQITRRQVLGVVGGVVAGALALKGGIDTAESAGESTASLVRRVGRHSTKSKQDGQIIEKPVFQSRPITDFELVYPWLADEDRDGAFEQFNLETAKIRATISPDQIRAVGKYEDLIRQSAQDAKIPANLLLGLVFWESKGNPKAVSDSKPPAKGLSQMKAEIAQKYGLKVSDGDDDDRFIPEKILPATAREIHSYIEQFGNIGLAFWTWHAGIPKVYAAINTYMDGQLPDINVMEADDSEEARAEATQEAGRIINLYRETIKNERINLYKLFQNPNVQEMFQGEEWDETESYVRRVLATIDIYDSDISKVQLSSESTAESPNPNS